MIHTQYMLLYCSEYIYKKEMLLKKKKKMLKKKKASKCDFRPLFRMEI